MRNSDLVVPEEFPAKIVAEKLDKAGRVVNLPPDGYPLDQLEREVVVEALERCRWNQTAAARFLRIPRHTLIYRMGKYSITPEGRKP
jgi:two-component system, NtrC family, response regulator